MTLSPHASSIEAQERNLKAAGIEESFQEQTGAVSQRMALQDAIIFCLEDDVLTVRKLDRLVRSVPIDAKLLPQREV